MAPSRNTVIESLGVYLPPRRLTTAEILRGCRQTIRFPLERMTGIETRCVAGEAEFAVDLAAQAVSRCLATSRFAPEEIDLLICASIGRYDGPGMRLSYEPCTAVRLKQRFGLHNALAFDLASACSGMFCGMYIADAMLEQGLIRCALVTSGEYITHLIATAQREIEDYLDPRMACLTVGDAGAAAVLTTSPEERVGFQALDLCTLGTYSGLCVGRPTEQAHGGAIMLTDALKLSDVAMRHGSVHALETMRRRGWAAESFDHLIMHQTSKTALAGAAREINRLLGRDVCRSDNTIDNLRHRGNTASTTHLVALHDAMQSGRVRKGDRIVFAVSGSGFTMGTGLYVMDDLPERMAQGTSDVVPRTATSAGATLPARPPGGGRVRIESCGTESRAQVAREGSTALLAAAAADCLARSRYGPADLGLVVHAGTYRTDFVGEPAIAALLAGQLAGAAEPGASEARMLAFDVFDGEVAFLDACHVATALILAGRTRAALVAAAEIENNREHFPEDLVGLAEVGSALLLDRSPGGESGFGGFAFRTFPEHVDAFTSYCTNRERRRYLHVARCAHLEDLYVECVMRTLPALMEREDLPLSRITHVLGPQRSPGFVSRLGEALGVSRERLVDVTRGSGDLATSSIAFGLKHVLDRRLATSGDVALLVSVGSGIQVGCAVYYF